MPRDRVAVVTGAGSGIGRAVSLALLEDGYRVVLAGRRKERLDPRGGRIINNGSISATTPRAHSAPYTATKHAVTGLTKSLALDGRPFDIACGQIDIGNARTELAAKMSQGVPQADGRVAAEPVMDVAHVGRAVVQMASLPLDANVLTLTIMATQMPYVGRG